MGSDLGGLSRADVDQILAKTAGTPYAHALLYGPYGTGKTMTALLSHKPDQLSVPVTITESTTAAALVGHFLIRGGETVWHDNAPGLFAWEHGALLVINEVDKARGDVEDILHVLLDDPAAARLRLPSGREVRPRDGFRCIATMNGDLDDLPGALLDRFSILLPVLRPSAHVVGTLPPDVAAAVDYIYSEAGKTDGGSPRYTFRQMRNFAEHRKRFPEKTAALMVTGRADRASALVELVSMLRLASSEQKLQGHPGMGTAPGSSPGASPQPEKGQAGGPRASGHGLN